MMGCLPMFKAFRESTKPKSLEDDAAKAHGTNLMT
jgi:hypothetical protein